MEESELPLLEYDLKRIFTKYESTLRKYGVPKEIRYELAEDVIRQTFYSGATNTSDEALKYKDFDDKELEEAKINKKIDLFEKILKEYVA